MNNEAIPFTSSQPMRVLVLRGGPSSERDISLITGAAIAAGLGRAGHAVIESDIMPDDVSALDRDDFDVVFIAMHGAFGESGEVQALCEERGLLYTGSGPVASRMAMDKVQSKQCFVQGKLETPAWVLATPEDAQAARNTAIAELGLPVVVKPVDGGSSVDVTITGDAEGVVEAVDDLVSRYGSALVEAFIAGRELTVGVLGNEPLDVLEIVPGGDFYDKFAKYDDDAPTQYLFEHGISEATCERVRSMAMKAHEVLGCRDMSRSDFILDASGVPWLLEINTIPGFTPHSLLPMSAAHRGIGFDELADRLVQMAANRALQEKVM
jgi:D-alanine-D-alanine ligase